MTKRLSELRRHIRILLIALIVVLVSLLVALYASNILSSHQRIDSLSDLGTITIGSHYLTRAPYFPDNSDKITKIFLESATLRYDYSNVSFTSDSGYDSHEGVPAVVINATIRNDYAMEEIIQFSQGLRSDCVVGIDVYMFDKQENFVGTLSHGEPLRGCYTLIMKSGETASINMIFATSNRNVDYFEIYVSALPLF